MKTVDENTMIVERGEKIPVPSIYDWSLDIWAREDTKITILSREPTGAVTYRIEPARHYKNYFVDVEKTKAANTVQGLPMKLPPKVALPLMDEATLKRLSEVDLVMMIHELRRFPEDADCLRQVQKELEERAKHNGEVDEDVG